MNDIWIVYENYCGEIYELMYVTKESKARHYTKLLNETSDEKCFNFRKFGLECGDKANLDKVVRLLEVYGDEDGDFEINKHIIIDKPEFPCDRYGCSELFGWNFTAYIKVDTFDYDIHEIKSEFNRRLEIEKIKYKENK